MLPDMGWGDLLWIIRLEANYGNKQSEMRVNYIQSMTDPNGTFIRLSEINEMIADGVLTVDFDKLEQRIFNKTVIKYG